MQRIPSGACNIPTTIRMRPTSAASGRRSTQAVNRNRTKWCGSCVARSVGWRVAGMATQLADSEEPVFLDFEDLTAMEDTVQKAETASKAAAGTAAAQNAETTNPIR